MKKQKKDGIEEEAFDLYADDNYDLVDDMSDIKSFMYERMPLNDG